MTMCSLRITDTEQEPKCVSRYSLLCSVKVDTRVWLVCLKVLITTTTGSHQGRQELDTKPINQALGLWVCVSLTVSMPFLSYKAIVSFVYNIFNAVQMTSCVYFRVKCLHLDSCCKWSVIEEKRWTRNCTFGFTLYSRCIPTVAASSFGLLLLHSPLSINVFEYVSS